MTPVISKRDGPDPLPVASRIIDAPPDCRRRTLLLSLGLPAAAGEPSPEYRDALRRTIEHRDRRRAGAPRRPGRIVPYPMPPALIIRQTPETHDQIDAVLRALRGT